MYSVPTNIVEGNGRKSQKDYHHFLIIARASLQETRYLIYLAKDLEYINDQEYQNLENDLKQLKLMINGFIRNFK